ncbi:hypothetical protein B0J18DRAFT_163414 [Chaetomium sp. MPI-SDFR-AT-0129]|nr:hypothetical protein B0J18DRAFT_163414 [Chaetomium sp. MPI-SDFR-AT-0129]
MFQAETSAPLQSIRSSCDRCRLQKLKCTVQAVEPDGRMVCERCVRAKVPCVFGRRRRASRPSESKKQQQQADKESNAATTSSTTPTAAANLKRAAAPTSVPLQLHTQHQHNQHQHQHAHHAHTHSHGHGRFPSVDTGVLTPPLSTIDPPFGLGTPMETLMDCDSEGSAYFGLPSRDTPVSASTNFPCSSSTCMDVDVDSQSLSHQGVHSPYQISASASASGSMMDWGWLDENPFSGTQQGSSAMDELYCLDPELLGTTTTTSTDMSTPSSGAPSLSMGSTPTDYTQALASSSSMLLEATANPNPDTPLPTTTLSTTTTVDSTPSAPRRLPALIAEMQQRLELLEHGGWLDPPGPGSDDISHARSFDRYPIGAVLRLTQEFGALTGEVWVAPSLSAGCCNGSDRCEKGDGQGQGPNVSTVLLVLGGYVLLVRLHALVLAHLHAHLERLPSPHSHGHAHSHSPTLTPDQDSPPSHQPPTTPTGSKAMSMGVSMTMTSTRLRLADLLPHSSPPIVPPEVSRIHAALGMLLAALHGVEAQLGRGGERVRGLVVALVSGSGSGSGLGGSSGSEVEGFGVLGGLEQGALQDGLGELGERVKLVKGLLREKMGL